MILPHAARIVSRDPKPRGVRRNGLQQTAIGQIGKDIAIPGLQVLPYVKGVPVLLKRRAPEISRRDRVPAILKMIHNRAKTAAHQRVEIAILKRRITDNDRRRFRAHHVIQNRPQNGRMRDKALHSARARVPVHDPVRFHHDARAGPHQVADRIPIRAPEASMVQAQVREDRAHHGIRRVSTGRNGSARPFGISLAGVKRRRGQRRVFRGVRGRGHRHPSARSDIRCRRHFATSARAASGSNCPTPAARASGTTGDARRAGA
ncbi:MAG: hypothetical protein BWY59_00622 [Verrucomicrobia bacterium ADurb.Bin345]|nr:MAG: hypothetical protein BWY59_00622 [Verrucomicrobia bacterium ADurb.Bin345]